MNSSTKKIIFWVSIFSIAMGMLESAVVVYLRELYYPEGFAFPLKMMSANIALTEMIREAATLIMLIAIGVFAGRTKTEKFAYFIYAFAVWDIFYYVFLKLLLNWPASIFTWDILFLLPVTWVGPVIAPLLLSFLMVLFALSIIRYSHTSNNTSIKKQEWLLLIVGSLTCIIAFTFEYTAFMLQEFTIFELLIPTEKLMHHALLFVPQKFPWGIFVMGVGIIVAGIGRFIYRNVKHAPGTSA